MNGSIARDYVDCERFGMGPLRHCRTSGRTDPDNSPFSGLVPLAAVASRVRGAWPWVPSTQPAGARRTGVARTTLVWRIRSRRRRWPRRCCSLSRWESWDALPDLRSKKSRSHRRSLRQRHQRKRRGSRSRKKMSRRIRRFENSRGKSRLHCKAFHNTKGRC